MFDIQLISIPKSTFTVNFQLIRKPNIIYPANKKTQYYIDNQLIRKPDVRFPAIIRKPDIRYLANKKAQ